MRPNIRSATRIFPPSAVVVRKVSLALVALSLVAVSGCGPEDTSGPQASSGQVKPMVASGMSTFAAARFAEQTTFGATPTVTKEIASQGVSAWINAQMSLPLAPIQTPDYAIDFGLNDQIATRRAFTWLDGTYQSKVIMAPDQLRQRVIWALLQYIPVNGQVQPYGIAEYFNVLQRNAFGNYRTLLRDVTVNRAMGFFLNNDQNKAVSAQCLSCAPNENYARELLQLFSIGVVQLNPDGTIVRDSTGKPKEAYSQKDVEELARALTGWSGVAGGNNGGGNWANFGFEMIPSSWSAEHDRDAKVVLGKNFPAGREAPQELETILDLLMAHPNIAPFVALRMIQHLVTSDPSPQYLGRVSAVFRNNGLGVAGDMKATIRAVLLDPEARVGDVPGASSSRFGKLKEPFLWWTAVLRGLGCSSPLKSNDGGSWLSPISQTPFNAQSVFSFYAPTDRAPGSNLLAPEQKLLGANEMVQRQNNLKWIFAPQNAASNSGAGCQVAALEQAFALSPQAFVDEVSARWFRGAMPPTLRTTLISLANSQNWSSPGDATLTLLGFALTSPYFGVMK